MLNELSGFNLTNCGVVQIKSGSITLAELEGELSEIFSKDWPWQIRELEAGNFLVRFPPNKKVFDIKKYPSFSLRKEGVQVEVCGRTTRLNLLSETLVFH